MNSALFLMRSSRSAASGDILTINGILRSFLFRPAFGRAPPLRSTPPRTIMCDDYIYINTFHGACQSASIPKATPDPVRFYWLDKIFFFQFSVFALHHFNGLAHLVTCFHCCLVLCVYKLHNFSSYCFSVN